MAVTAPKTPSTAKKVRASKTPKSSRKEKTAASATAASATAASATAASATAEAVSPSSVSFSGRVRKLKVSTFENMAGSCKASYSYNPSVYNLVSRLQKFG